MGSRVVFTWRGGELQLRQRRAYGRGLIGIGEAVATRGKENAHVITGTMRRSIHTAEPDYTGGNDLGIAQGGGEPRNLDEPVFEGIDAALEVGSWVPYACVEETGRGHTFMAPAVEEVSGAIAEGLMREAFAQEGLLV